MDDSALELQRPDVPVNLNDLAARKGEGSRSLEARHQVLTTIRKFAIMATWPEDWLLFKAPAEQAAGRRVPARTAAAIGCAISTGSKSSTSAAPRRSRRTIRAVFQYRITGSGRCKLTRQIVEEIEGGRSSTDDFCKGKSGSDLDLSARKAARAN